MSTKTMRRQVMLLLIFAAIAYAWWQTSIPSRYAEMPIDHDPMGIMPRPPGLDSPGLMKVTAQKEEWIYSSDSASLSVGWEPIDSTVQVYVRKSQFGAPLEKLEATLVDGYYPATITFRDAAEGIYRLSFSSDSIDIQAPDEDALRLPFPMGAVFKDFICFQAMAWKGLRDTVRTQMVALVPDAIPIRSYPVVIRPVDETTIEVVGADSQRVTLVYDTASPRVTHFCAENGLCADAQPPYEK